jgi:hypothetical protein
MTSNFFRFYGTASEDYYNFYNTDWRYPNLLAYGRGGNDSIVGNSGHDTIYGENGDDALFGLGGQDYIDGGRGKDRIAGASGSDFLFGNSGNDTLEGGKGDDFILGGAGQDILGGGDASDIFVFDDCRLPNRDYITDFSVDMDTIALGNSLDKGLANSLGSGIKGLSFQGGNKDKSTLNANAFFKGADFTGSAAGDAPGIYVNITNGDIWYNDSDASGSHIVANVGSTAHLMTNADFVYKSTSLASI